AGRQCGRRASRRLQQRLPPLAVAGESHGHAAGRRGAVPLDLEFTVLQPAMYLQGLAGSWRTAVRTGKFTMPYSAASRMSLVDYRDVADAVAEAFASDTLVGGTFELAAPGMYTRRELAQAMSRRAG